MFCENPAPTVKTAARGVVTAYTMYLPYVSESGAAIRGPNPSARTYKDWGKSATVELVSNFSWTMG